MIRIFAGYDPNEAAGYHTFCHSVITRASEPVSITPIIKNQFPWWEREKVNDNPGATEFSFSRFLIPHLCNYEGFAIFMDGADMLCCGDVAELWALRDEKYAVKCVQHPEYIPTKLKMWNQENRAYPRKNWSSVMIINCEKAKELTHENVATQSGGWLHRLQWTEDHLIGDLPKEWNVLIGEQDVPENAKILHYTLGLPDGHAIDGVADYMWRKERAKMNYITTK